jgi:hypothetical protein
MFFRIFENYLRLFGKITKKEKINIAGKSVGHVCQTCS